MLFIAPDNASSFARLAPCSLDSVTGDAIADEDGEGSTVEDSDGTVDLSQSSGTFCHSSSAAMDRLEFRPGLGSGAVTLAAAMTFLGLAAGFFAPLTAALVRAGLGEDMGSASLRGAVMVGRVRVPLGTLTSTASSPLSGSASITANFRRLTGRGSFFSQVSLQY